MPISKDYTYTLAANAEVVINRSGNYVRCISAGEAFNIQGMNNFGEPDDKVEINEGIAHTLDNFDKLRVINGSNSQTIKIYVGSNRVDDTRQYGSVSATISSVANLSTTSDVTLTNGAAAAQIIAANANRQTLHILNTHATATLRVGDTNAGASRGIPIGPGLSFTMNNFDGALYGYADGANIDVAVLEVTS